MYGACSASFWELQASSANFNWRRFQLCYSPTSTTSCCRDSTCSIWHEIAVLIRSSTYSPRCTCSFTYACKMQGLKKVQTVIIACFEPHDWHRASRFGSSLTETETWKSLICGAWDMSCYVDLLVQLCKMCWLSVWTVCRPSRKWQEETWMWWLWIHGAYQQLTWWSSSKSRWSRHKTSLKFAQTTSLWWSDHGRD